MMLWYYLESCEDYKDWLSISNNLQKAHLMQNSASRPLRVVMSLVMTVWVEEWRLLKGLEGIPGNFGSGTQINYVDRNGIEKDLRYEST